MAKPLPLEWRKDQVPQEINDLHGLVENLPLPHREHLKPLCDRLAHFTRLQSRVVRMAQDTVDQLQLDIKYLLFDLEATRRERDELRDILEEIEEDEGFM